MSRIISHRCRSIAAALLICVALAGAAAAQDGLEFSGRVDFGLRHYDNAGLFAGQSGAGLYPFAAIQIDASAPLGPGDVVLQFTALEDDENGRSYQRLSKAYYARASGGLDVLLGWNVENWGVAESHSIMNVINPSIATDVLGRNDLVGTPMLNVNFATRFGTLSGYALFGGAEPKLPGRASRHRGLFGTDADRAVYQGDKNDVDFALRFTKSLSLGAGSLDMAAHYFTGTSRRPKALPGCTRSFGPITEAVCDGINRGVVGFYEAGIPRARDPQELYDRLLGPYANDDILSLISAIPAVGFIPYYQETQQLGASLVFARDDLQLRFEGTYTLPRNEDGYFSTVLGGDYQVNGLGSGRGSLNLVVEYLYDNRDSRQPRTVFDNDLFLGGLHRFNNPRDVQVRLGGFYDLDSHAKLLQFGVSTRLTDALTMEMNGMHVDANGWNDPLSFVDKDNFIELKFSTYF